MGNQTRLSEWVIQHAGVLKLKLHELRWPPALALDSYQFRAEINVEGRSFFGLGGADNKDAAVTKAVAEAIERYTVAEHRLDTTNGVALHVDYSRAAAFATLELLERDAFLCHYLTNTPYTTLDGAQFLGENAARVVYHLQKSGLQINFGVLRAAVPEIKVVLCCINGLNWSRPFGLIYGMGSSPHIDESCRKSWEECARGLSGIVAGARFQAMDIDEFLRLRRATPVDHMRLAWDLDYARRVTKVFHAVDGHYPSQRFEDPQITHRVLEIKHGQFSMFPGFVVQAQSPRAQKLFFGANSNEPLINFERLSAFAGRPIKKSDLTALPHPLA